MKRLPFDSAGFACFAGLSRSAQLARPAALMALVALVTCGGRAVFVGIVPGPGRAMLDHFLTT